MQARVEASRFLLKLVIRLGWCQMRQVKHGERYATARGTQLLMPTLLILGKAQPKRIVMGDHCLHRLLHPSGVEGLRNL